jgi:hypothetical protein
MPVYGDTWRRSGSELVESTGQRVTLGKDPSNTVVIDHDRTMSRLAAVLEDYGVGWLIPDRGSRRPDVTRRERDVLAALCRPVFCGEPFRQPASTRRIARDLMISGAA